MYSVTKKAATIGTAVAFSVVGAATYAVVTNGSSNSSAQSSVVNGNFSDATTTATPTAAETATSTESASATPSMTATTAPTDSAAPAPSDTTSAAPPSQPASPPELSSAAPPSSTAPAVKAPPPPSGPCYTNHSVLISVSGSAKDASVAWRVGSVSGSGGSIPWSHSASAYGCGAQVSVEVIVNNPAPGSPAPTCSIEVDGATVASCGGWNGNGVSALATVR